MTEQFSVQPLTIERFDDFAAVLGRTGVGGCWCMYWVWPTVKEWRDNSHGGAAAGNRAAVRALVAAGQPPGLVAYEGQVPVAWCRVLPRDRLPALGRSRAFRTDLDTTGVWSLSCFVVRRSHRGRGLVEVLTRAAAAHARERGATVLEVYPSDVEGRTHAADMWRGAASTFRRLGFVEVQRAAPDRPMMRLALDEAAVPGSGPPPAVRAAPGLP